MLAYIPAPWILWVLNQMLLDNFNPPGQWTDKSARIITSVRCGISGLQRLWGEPCFQGAWEWVGPHFHEESIGKIWGKRCFDMF